MNEIDMIKMSGHILRITASHPGFEVWNGGILRDIVAWSTCIDEWEALTETEKCQYDVLAVLGQV